MKISNYILDNVFILCLNTGGTIIKLKYVIKLYWSNAIIEHKCNDVGILAKGKNLELKTIRPFFCYGNIRIP